jgi:fatty acid-binding protein DegV
VLHTGNLEAALAVRDALDDLIPAEEALIVEVNPSLGTHVGAQAVGVALVSKT